MEEQNCINNWKVSPLAMNWVTNTASALLGAEDANQHYIMPPGCNGIDSVFAPVPQWMYYQKTTQNYVEFLSERAYPELDKQILSKISTQMPPNLGLADPFHMKQSWSEQGNHVIHEYLGSGVEASKHPSTAHRKRSREKAYAADRCRRLRISRWLDALQELVPRSKEGGKTAFLDDVIAHVKYLQYQVKDLCQSRLGGESTSNPLIFVEGLGHYIVQEQMLYGPLEEVMGKLIRACPSAATELLQSKGLVIMPMTVAEGFLEPK